MWFCPRWQAAVVLPAPATLQNGLHGGWVGFGTPALCPVLTRPSMGLKKMLELSGA